MKTVFIAMGIHLVKTKSSLFFIDILKEIYPDLYIISENDAWYYIPKIKPDNIIIWQAIFTPKEIDSWKAKNVTIIPMYDACPHTLDFWNQYKKYKVFCFSKTLYLFLKDNNFDVLYKQYYTDTKQINKNYKKNSVFFWERGKDIPWSTVKKLFADLKIDLIHYHYATNVREKNTDLPTDIENKEFNITYSDWFKNKEEYNNILNSSTFYIAPRLYEGIGMSFIEALGNGCIVIASNTPTMNEYITDGVDGFLFDTKNPHEIKFEKKTLKEISKKSIQRFNSGRENWIKSIPDIQEFINKPLKNYYPKISFYTYIQKRILAFLRFYKKKILK